MFAISVHVLKGDSELCHLTIVPVCPLKVNDPLVEPEQIFVPPVTEPPTVVGFTTMLVVLFAPMPPE